MGRYVIHLAYNGTAYFGWQIQPHQTTVQEVLTNALMLLLKQNIEITGAGRTDTGVHARNYYAHFDISQPIEDIDILTFRLNSFLPKDIVIYRIFEVAPNFHARFSAVERTYKYYISTSKNPFNPAFSYRVFEPLNLDLMNEGCTILLNTKNFKSFSKVHTQVNNFNCEIYKAVWTKENDLLVFEISANRFLRNMVRSLVGTLIDLGREKINLNDFKAIINAQNRAAAGTSVPAHALFLENIRYDNENLMPQ